MASPTVSPHPLHLLLPQLGAEEDFAAFREVLRYCDFTKEGICRRLGIPSIAEFQPKCDGRKTAIEMEQPIDAILRLVLDGEFVPESTLDSLPAGGSGGSHGAPGNPGKNSGAAR